MKRIILLDLMVVLSLLLFSGCKADVKNPNSSAGTVNVGSPSAEYSPVSVTDDQASKQIPHSSEQNGTKQQKTAILCAYFYHGGETGETVTMEYTYEGELTAQKLAEGLTDWTGLNFTVSADTKEKMVIVVWAKDSALFKAEGELGLNNEFTFPNDEARAWFMLDSFWRTIINNLDVEDAYYSMDGGKPLVVPSIAYPEAFQADIPYLGSAFYDNHSDAKGNEEPLLSERDAMELLAQTVCDKL